MTDHRRRSGIEAGSDAAWRKARVLVLAEEPLCRLCSAQGRVVAATVVDHILPKAQHPELRLERENLQPLCKTCHDGMKREQEHHGYSSRVGADGYPTDPAHPANCSPNG